jgi:hypothetical protein
MHTNILSSVMLSVIMPSTGMMGGVMVSFSLLTVIAQL